ncbi:MAG: YlbF family regulator [Lachnospirales bacterium]
MSIYFDKARELGEMILASEQANTLSEATIIFQNNPEAKAKMDEYNKYQADVRNSMQSGELSKEEITKMTQRLTEMAVNLKQDEIVGGLVFAENEFNGFVNQVMSVLKVTIMGDENKINECTQGDCSSCKGC